MRRRILPLYHMYKTHSYIHSTFQSACYLEGNKNALSIGRALSWHWTQDQLEWCQGIRFCKHLHTRIMLDSWYIKRDKTFRNRELPPVYSTLLHWQLGNTIFSLCIYNYFIGIIFFVFKLFLCYSFLLAFYCFVFDCIYILIVVCRCIV